MNKKVLVPIAVVTTATLLFAACGKSSDASSAAKLSTNTANRTEAIIQRIDTVNESQFRFPSVFDTDFFVQSDAQTDNTIQTNDIQTMDAQTNDVQTYGGNTRRRSFDHNAQRTETGTSNSARRIIRNNPNRYKSKHFEMGRLNENNKKRNAYLDKMDDLYVLCADISAANDQINEKVASIKAKASELKQAGREVKAAGKTFRNSSKFNRLRNETNKDLSELLKDRNNIKNRVKALPRTGASVDVDAMTMRYNVIMGKLDKRLQLLTDVETGLEEMTGVLREGTSAATQRRQKGQNRSTRQNGTRREGSRSILGSRNSQNRGQNDQFRTRRTRPQNRQQNTVDENGVNQYRNRWVNRNQNTTDENGVNQYRNRWANRNRENTQNENQATQPEAQIQRIQPQVQAVPESRPPYVRQPRLYRPESQIQNGESQSGQTMIRQPRPYMQQQAQQTEQTQSDQTITPRPRPYMPQQTEQTEQAQSSQSYIRQPRFYRPQLQQQTPPQTESTPTDATQQQQPAPQTFQNTQSTIQPFQSTQQATIQPYQSAAQQQNGTTESQTEICTIHSGQHIRRPVTLPYQVPQSQQTPSVQQNAQ